MSGSPDLSEHRGEKVLALGVASIVCSIFGPCCMLGSLAAIPLGIVAKVMGHGDIQAMNAGTMDPTGLKATRAGEVCGMIGAALGLLSPLLFIGAALFFDPSLSPRWG